MSTNDKSFTDPDVAALRQYDESASNYLKDILFGDDLSKRQKWIDLVENNPIFYPKYNMTLDDHWTSIGRGERNRIQKD